MPVPSCVTVPQVLVKGFPATAEWAKAKEHVRQCASALIADADLPAVLAPDGDLPTRTARIVWTTFTFCYFFGTKRMVPQPQVKTGVPRQDGTAGGRRATTPAAVPPLLQEAADCLGRMVGTDGWCRRGHVSKAIQEWVSSTRKWLDGSFGQQGWTTWQAVAVHCAAASSAPVSGTNVSAIRMLSAKSNEPKSGTSKDSEPQKVPDFFPFYPLCVAGGYNENRPKVRPWVGSHRQQQAAVSASRLPYCRTPSGHISTTASLTPAVRLTARGPAVLPAGARGVPRRAWRRLRAPARVHQGEQLRAGISGGIRCVRRPHTGAVGCSQRAERQP